ncbi:MAG: hypothetical protein MUF14_10575, partial [Hyphomonadaceae bacterium]|nr:hypothetical protein [Hyphomonadaceae bacterium]
MNRREIVGGIGAAALVLGAPHAGRASGVQLARSDIAADIALLRRIYTSLHPGLYRYSTPAEISTRFAALEARFSGPADLPSVYLGVSQVLASVRCGHSYANFYNQSEAVKQALFAGANRLPFKFAWLDEMMVVTDPAGADGLSAGTRISHVNGVPTRRILS